MLQATGLTKRYNGQTALDHLDLKIDRGEVFCCSAPTAQARRRRSICF